MTATEFWERRENRGFVSTGLCLIASILTVAAITVEPKVLMHTSSVHYVGRIVLAEMFVIWGIVVTLVFWSDKRLVREHPEMEHLEQWVSVMGHVELYPTKASEKVALAETAAWWLEDSARTANKAFEMHEKSTKELGRYKLGSPERAVLEKGCDLWATIVQTSITRYHKRWNLLIETLHVLSGTRYADATTYRQGLLSQD
jgi:hypothetical protein